MGYPKLLKILALLALAMHSRVAAQKLSPDQVSGTARSSFATSAPGVSPEWMSGENGGFEAWFLSDNIQKVYIYDSNGSLRVKKTQAVATEIPAGLLAALKSHYGNSNYVSAYKVFTSERQKFFEVKCNSGADLWRFNPDGSLLDKALGSGTVASATPPPSKTTPATTPVTPVKTTTPPPAKTTPPAASAPAAKTTPSTSSTPVAKTSSPATPRNEATNKTTTTSVTNSDDDEIIFDEDVDALLRSGSDIERLKEFKELDEDEDFFEDIDSLLDDEQEDDMKGVPLPTEEKLPPPTPIEDEQISPIDDGIDG